VPLVDDVPLLEEDQKTMHEPALVDYVTPEGIVLAAQLADTIVAAVSRSSQHAARVMKGLLLDESLAETAAAAGMSTARVNQLRRQIRDAAQKYLATTHAG
jgi:hypothetical protein